MREFRIKVNNEKTYVVKANDYNQAVKTLHSKLRDFDLTNFLALKRSLELRIGEEIDFDKLEEYVNKLPKDKNGKKNVDVKEVIKCCIKAKDNAVSDSISKYNGEDAIRTNGFVRIKEDGDWTSYKYNGSSDFDDAVFKIHQYNPSLIAFVSNGNETITVRNKYLNDDDSTAQGEIEVLKSFGFDYKDGRWVKESNNNDIIVQPDYHYVSVIGPGDTEKHCKKYQYQSAGMLKKIIASNIKDSSIKDVSYVSGKNLKIGQKIVEDGEVLEVVDIKETQRGINNDYRDVTFKNIKTGATETTHFGNKALARLTDKLIESGSKEALSKNIATEIKAGKDPKQAAAIAYSVQRENDASTGYKYRITNNGSKWYYETTFPDGHTTLTGPYSSKQETEQYFHKHRPTEKLTDADPVKVEKIIRKEKSALGVTYYIFQTKSSSGYTIYYQVTDRTYHGEPTYSGGGIISLSLKSANDTLDHNLLSDKLKAKYGEKEGTKRYLRGENDSAIEDSNIKDAGEEIRYLEGMKFNGVPYTGWAVQHWTDGYYTFDGKKPYIPSGGRDALLSIFKQGGFIGQWKGIKPDKGFESYFRHSTAVPAVRDSNNIKNRKSYTIKVGDKQYKIFAESEEEAINKYIKSKKQ